jgi:competence protein ComEC
MADPVVLVSLALLAGAPLALAPGATLLVVAGVLVALRGRVGRAAAIVGGIGLALAAGRATSALRDAHAIHDRALALLTPPARCDAAGVIVGSPVVIGRPRPGADDEKARVDIELRTGTCGERAIEAPLRARVYGAPEDLARGDEVAVLADLAPLHLFHQVELPDPFPTIARSRVTSSGGAVEVRVTRRSWSVGALIDRARARVRARIERTFHPDASALGRALVLGESDLDPTDDEAFRVSGLSHLLAVSGTHLVLVVVGFAAVLKAILARVEIIAARLDPGRVAAAVAVPAAWLYADFAGGSGSAVRAAAMLSATMAARASGRRAATVRAFAGSLALLALVDPLVACDVSFSLSASATAGLVVLQKPLAAWLLRGPIVLRALLAPVATTLAATLGCAPVLALLAPTMPVLGVASNLVAAPLGELAALPICLAHALLWWAPGVERGAALLGSGALLGVRGIARWSTATGAVMAVPPPTPVQLGVLVVGGAAIWAATTARRKLAMAAIGAASWLVAELAAASAGAPRSLLRVTVLDVGQGDGLLVDLPDGELLLIDGGGMVGNPVDLGARVLQPVLRARRRQRVDVMVLSHPHPDHFGGLASTLPLVDVGELWDTGQGEDLGAGPLYASLLATARRKGVPLRRPSDLCGAPREAGGATIEVLAPCPGYDPDGSANDNSLVLRIRYGHQVALLVGDAEHEEEQRLLAHYGSALRADFLKVGHHGSRTSSSPAFLRAVQPALAAISSGVRNRFGHPHPQTLNAFVAQGIPLARTDRGGAIVWETDGDTARLRRP